MLCYNHANFISECLDSILAQKTSFEFEVIVGDDVSTDGSREILREFGERYPGVLRLLLHEEHVGGISNYFATHSLARGQYICHVDGDDCACPGKLQKQADFLDAHLGCVFVGHNMKIRIGEHDVSLFSYHEIPTISDINYLVVNNCFFAGSSKMYRREVAVLESKSGERMRDFLIHLEQAFRGHIGYINEPLGVYRKTPGSVTMVERQPVLEAHVRAYQHALVGGVAEDVVNQGLTRFLTLNAFFSLTLNDRKGFDFCTNVLIQKGLCNWKCHLMRLVAQFSFSLACLLSRAHLIGWAMSRT